MNLTHATPDSGLYRDEFERDSCGFGLIANMDDQPSHWLVATAIQALSRLTHRGAVAADGKTGDGCGLLLKKPVAFLRAVAAEQGIVLAEQFAAGIAFMSRFDEQAARARAALGQQLEREGLEVAGWRELPTDSGACGEEALRTLPRMEMVFVNGQDTLDEATFNRRLFLARRRTEKALEGRDPVFYMPSLSASTLVYKGMVMPAHLTEFYPDLADPRLETSVAVFHQRFSTNTLPQWRLAHPYRFLAHNGEINTIQGNRSWAVARGPLFRSPLLPDVPTLDEQGIKGYEVNTWFGFVAPAGTPPDVVARLNTEFNRIFASAEAKEKLGPQGFDLAPPMAPAAFGKIITDDLGKWVPIVKAAGATANLRVLPAGEGISNCGFAKFGLRRSHTDPGVWEIHLAVRNYTDSPRPVTVVLQFAGAPAGTRRMELAPGAESTHPTRRPAAPKFSESECTL